MSHGAGPRAVSLGTGMVYYHSDRPIVHFGNAHEESYRPTSTHKIEVIKELPK